MTTLNTTNGTISGAPVTLDLAKAVSPDLLRNEIDNRIVKIRPSATPVDQISRHAQARHAGSMIVNYYAVDTQGSNAVVMQKSNPDDKGDWDGLPYDITVDTPEIFAPSETLLVPSIPGTDKKGNPAGALILYIVGITNGKLRVLPVNCYDSDGKATAPTLLKGTEIVRMGRAAAELDVQTCQFATLPRKEENYCQIFKAQVEESTLMKISNKEVGWTFNDQEEVAILDMRQGMERNFLFGNRCRVYDPEKRTDIFLTGGIWHQAGKESRYEIGNLDFEKLIQISRHAFTGVNGSSRKILIGGTGLIEQLHKLEATKMIAAGETMTRWGLDFNEIVTKFGRLYVIASETFDQCGRPNDGIIIDPEYLTKYTHVPFSTERLDLRGAGVRNTDAIVITEASCLVLRYPNAHCRIVGQVPVATTATAA